MCLILFSIDEHPRYKLMVAANRDEFYKRKTAPAAFWTDHPDVLAGRDLEAMGTWMGVSRTGRIGMITNYRDPINIRANAPSRGKLVSDFLIGDQSPESYLQAVQSNGPSYNGFNLLVGNPDELFYFSNYSNKILRVGNGLHGLSNHLLETPWPKVVRGKAIVKSLFDREKINTDEILDALHDLQPAPNKDLPDTGIGMERERALSSMFITTDNYGTRCSTVLLIDRDNRVIFAEREYDPVDGSYQTRSFKF